jgi:murein L,D-transpeptidase YafK
MTAERLEQERASEWHAFWTDLKEAHDLFEAHRKPPRVSVRAKRYTFRMP